MGNDEKAKNALKIKKIAGPNDIYLLLDRIHMSGISNDEFIKKLFCLLLGRDEWEFGHSMEFYGAILNQYLFDGELELLCAVSGVSEPYKRLSNPTERRNQYLIYLNDHDPNNKLLGQSDRTTQLQEKRALNKVADRLYMDYCDNKMFSLCQKWMAKIGLNPDDLKEPKKTSQPKRMPMSEDPKQDEDDTGSKKKKIVCQIVTSISITINNKPQNYLIGLIITVLVLLLVSPFSLAYTTLARNNIELFDNMYSYLNKPSIQSISVEKNEFTIEPGEEVDPGLMVVPAKAGKDHLECKITDRNIANITPEWTIIGKNGWKKGSDNTTDIKIGGDDAQPIKIVVHLVPPYIDSVKDGEYENQTDDGGYIDDKLSK